MDYKLRVIDVETTMNDENPRRSKSNPYYPENRIVLYGEYDINKSAMLTTTRVENCPNFWEDCDILIGHNIKFDLAYLGEIDGPVFEELLGVRIWDTQIAEYVLSGQLTSMASLDLLSEIYGFDTKTEAGHQAIKDLFAAGLGADHADPDDLAKYLRHDLKVTGDISCEQIKRATTEQFNLILQMGDMLKAVLIMETNGMIPDRDILEDRIVELEGDIASLTDDLLSDMRIMPGVAKYLEAKGEKALNSRHFLSCLLFGGKFEYDVRVPNGLYKSGKKKGEVRYKIQKNVLSLAEPDWSVDYRVPTTQTTNLNSPVYVTDEDVLEGLAREGDPFAQGIVAIRKKEKVCNTYYRAFLEQTKGYQNETLHHALNQCITRTGRLSSSNPNLQNVPMADEDDPVMNVKSVFSHEDGTYVFVEIDFKQLEVCVLAWLTQDPQLIKDLTRGVDIHSEIGEQVLGKAKLTKHERREIKAVVFAMIYGAGYKGIAKSTGLTEAFVKEVMARFYERYNTIQEFYKQFGKEIEEHGARFDLIYRDDDGLPCHYFQWTSPTGRTYMFNQDPYRPGPKYTQMRNYPVQGTATGDIVPAVIAEIAEVITRETVPYEVLLTNTTHDSVTMEVEQRVLDRTLKMLNDKVFTKLDEIINTRLPGIEWDIPLEVEVEVGETWGTLKPYDMP